MKDETKYRTPISVEILQDTFSLTDRSKDDLIKLAKDLSNGCYEKESKQRREILQMIADKLAGKSGNPP